MSVNRKVKIVDEALCISTSTLCEMFDVHRNTVAQWVKLGLQKKTNGWYPLKETVEWVMDYRGASKKKSADPDEDDMSLAQQKLFYEAKLKEQQADAATLKNAIAKGEYIRREEVVSELQRFFVSLKRSMAGYSRRIAMEVAPYVEPEQARIIEQTISDTTSAALLQLSVRGVYDAKQK